MKAAISELKHGSFVQVGQLGVLILGESGAGKSTMALSLIDHTGRGTGTLELAGTLVADDQVCLWLDEGSGRVFGKAPKTIAGLLEIRGVGIVPVDYVPSCAVDLIVQIEPSERIERLPDFPHSGLHLFNQAIPSIAILAYDTAAAAKVRAGVVALLGSNAVENSVSIV